MDRLNKKKMIIIIVLVIAFIMAFVIFNAFNGTNDEEDKSELEKIDEISNGSDNTNATETLEFEIISYEYATMQFKQISAENLSKMLAENNKEIILFTSRKTCQWCRKVAPLLGEAAQNYEGVIYYLDSENTDINPALKKFRTDYGIDTVPSIIKFWGKDKYEKLELDIYASDNEVKSEIVKWISGM